MNEESDISPPGSEGDLNDRHNRQSSSWDIANAPANYSVIVAGHVATALLSFAAVWILTHYRGSEVYGSIVAFLAASQLVQVVLNWSATALTRFGLEEFVETGHITRAFWSRSWILLPNLALVVFTGLIWLPTLAGAFKVPMTIWWMIAVHLTTAVVWLHVQYALQAVKRMRLQSLLLAVERAIILVGLLSLLVLGRLELVEVLWCYITGSAVMIVVGAILLRPYVKVEDVFEAAMLRKMIRYSIPLLAFTLVGYLSTSQLDALFITRYMSVGDLGVYSVASQASGMAVQVPILATSLLMSLFVSLHTSKQLDTIRRFFRSILPSLALAWNVACLVAALLGCLLIPMVFGESFASATAPLFILLCGAASTAPTMFGYAAFSHALSASYISSVAAIFAASANVLLDFVLIPRYGLVGCALATLASAILLNAVVVVLTSKKGGVSVSWAPLSVLPAIAGVGLLLLTGNTTWASLGAVGLALVIAGWFWKPIANSARVLITREV